MQFASLIFSLINIISLDVTSFNSAVTVKLKCGKVVCVEFFIFGDRSSVAYRATKNLFRWNPDVIGIFSEQVCIYKKENSIIDFAIYFELIKTGFIFGIFTQLMEPFL